MNYFRKKGRLIGPARVQGGKVMRRGMVISLAVLLAVLVLTSLSARAVGDPEEIKSLRGLKTMAVEVAVTGQTAAAPSVNSRSVAAAIRQAFKRHGLKGSTRALATLRVSVQILNRNVTYISAQVVQSATLIRRPRARLLAVTWALNAPVPTPKIIQVMDRIVARLARDRRLAG
jgi:hypothetical protein